MKKTSIIIISMLLFVSAKAQDIKFGVKAGFNAGFIANEEEWFKPSPGYNVGLFASYELVDQLSVSLEPAYSITGSKDINILDLYSLETNGVKSFKLWDYSQNKAIEYKQHNLSLNMVELPILFHYSLDLGGMKARVFAGPSFDFILKATLTSYREDVTIGETTFNEIKSVEDVTDRFGYYDIAGVAGIGLDMELDPIDLSIDLSYKHGFKDINVVKDKSRLDLRTFNLSVGIGINKLFF